MSENEIAEKKVLALKYRPKRFEDLVGQSTISQTLSLALDSNRLSHAYLFSGLRGSGKTSTARIMAKALLCSNGPTSRPCEVCENCQSANTNRHLDVIEMDAASNRGIDDIKDLIEHTKYKPSSARFKVFIIDEVHMLTTQAFNALLKTLEEPPGFVKFILATTDPLKLPATILSRTQHFRFNKIASSDVMHHLSHILNEENIDFETPALEILTRSGQGSLRDTLTLLDQAIIFSKGKVTVPSVVDMLGLIEPELMDKVFDIILKKGDITEIVRELENYEISQVCDEMAIYLKQKMLEKDAKFDLLLFDRFFRIISDAKHLLAINSDGGFVLILTLSKMIEATNLKSIEDIINQVEQIEVKPVIKEAISPQKVVEHANNDVNHAYDDEPVNISAKLSSQNQIVSEPIVVEEKPIQEEVLVQKIEEEEAVQEVQAQQAQTPEIEPEIIETEHDATLSIDSVNAIPTVPPVEIEEVNGFATPFDETPFDEPVVVNDSQELVNEPNIKEQVVEPTPVVENVEVQEAPVQNLIQEPVVQEPVMQSPVEEKVEPNTSTQISEPSFEPTPEPIVEEVEEVDDPNKQLYERLTNKVYERDVQLGELFEDNFIYKSFENKKLQITSYAQGEDRKFLLKHYGVLKIFIYDIFGSDIEIEFIKEEAVEKKPEVQSLENNEPAALEDGNIEAGSMVEDIEMGSGCVADMQKTANPTPSQKELELNDVLNSSMLNSAKEIMHVKKITVKAKN